MIWLVILATIAYVTIVIKQKLDVRNHYRKWILPLHKSLSPMIGEKHDRDPREYIHLPRDFQTDPDVQIRIDLPDEFSGDETQNKRTIEGVIRGKLALHDAEMTYRLASDTPHILIHRAPAPPDVVRLNDAQTEIESGTTAEPFLGYAARRRVVRVKLDDESPHVLLSAGSGGGKSVVLRTIGAQGLRIGARLVICDIKRVSQSWAKGLPRVQYHRNIDAIHESLIELAAEATRRYDVIDAAEDEEQVPDVGERIFVLMEEMNATMTRLQRYWAKVRQPNDPKTSPAIDALGELLFTGRACLIHVIAVAQMATARSLGGPEVRENFATRILMRYSSNAWKMLTDIWPMPKSSRHIGRAQVVLAGEAVETQILFLTRDEARTMALQGGGVAEVSVKRPNLTVVPTEPQIERLSLQQACIAEWLPMNYETARKARMRDSEFPIGTAGPDGVKRYAREELERWHLNRERSRLVGEEA